MATTGHGGRWHTALSKNMTEKNPVSRRQVIATGLASAAAAVTGGAIAGCAHSAGEPLASVREGVTGSAPADGGSTPTVSRMPVVFLPHGGGPWPFVDLGFGEAAELEALATYLRSVGTSTPVRPRALLVVSAHWEEPLVTVMTNPNPPMYYDYYGFPPESYHIQWPAPGDPALAARVRALLGDAGFESAEDAERGYDHGTFVPLKLSYPEADVPVVQVSLRRGLDPAEHVRIGRALAPLRDEGVFIIGSGMTYHNLRAFSARFGPVSEEFDAWLQQAATAEQADRDAQLTQWAAAPQARVAHPREEHLLPLMVIAGAAGSDRGVVDYSGTLRQLRLSAYRYG